MLHSSLDDLVRLSSLFMLPGHSAYCRMSSCQKQDCFTKYEQSGSLNHFISFEVCKFFSQNILQSVFKKLSTRQIPMDNLNRFMRLHKYRQLRHTFGELTKKVTCEKSYNHILCITACLKAEEVKKTSQ